MTMPKTYFPLLFSALMAGLVACTVGPDEGGYGSYIEQRDAGWAEAYVRNNIQLYQVPLAAGYDVAVLQNDGAGPYTMISVPGAPSEHGWWADFTGDVRKDITFKVLERPGYGNSGPGHPVTDFEDHADAIAALLNREPGHCNVIMGSSFAGPIALLTAMREPEAVDGLIISAGLMKAPGRGARFLAFLGTAIRPLASLPKDIDTVRVEIVRAPRQRREVLSRLEEINVPVILVHGGMDTLVPPGNSEFLLRKLEDITDVSLTIVPEAEHDLMIAHPYSLQTAIDQVISKIEAQGGC